MTSGLGYRRGDLQQLSHAKLEDALILAKAGRHSNAYYLAGYAVELALKACISRQFLAETIPDPDLARRVFDHDLGKLVTLAGLSSALKEKVATDRNFAANWSTVTEWKVESRYEVMDDHSCAVLLDAIQDRRSGVLTWLRQFW